MNCADVVTLSPLYLAGELDPSRTAEFQTHLAACPQCARAIASQTELDARLREAVLAQDPDPAAVNRLIRSKIARPRWIMPAAGIAAALLLALLGYTAWLNGRVAQLYTDAALDHRREVIGHQQRTWAADATAIDALAQRHGLSASVLARLAFPGYRLERGKLCRLAGRVYLHLVYSNGNGEFSVFLRQPSGEPVPSTLESADRGEEHLASVKTNMLAAVVVTDQSTATARQFASVTASIL